MTSSPQVELIALTPLCFWDKGKSRRLSEPRPLSRGSRQPWAALGSDHVRLLQQREPSLYTRLDTIHGTLKTTTTTTCTNHLFDFTPEDNNPPPPPAAQSLVKKPHRTIMKSITSPSNTSPPAHNTRAHITIIPNNYKIMSVLQLCCKLQHIFLRVAAFYW